MKELRYEIIPMKITDTSQVPKGKDIYYKCEICGCILPSLPKDNIGCRCGNIFIDIDVFRLAVKDYSKMQVLRRI